MTALKLQQAGTDPEHQVIYLRSDQAVPFGVFATVMDAVKQAGITNVSIVTQRWTQKPRLAETSFLSGQTRGHSHRRRRYC